MKLWLFAFLLLVWGNLLGPLIGSSAVLPGGSVAFVVAGVALVAVSLVTARWLGLDAAGLGLTHAGALRGAAIGAIAAGAIAAIDVTVVQLAPAIIGRPLVYEPLSRVAGPDLASHIAIFLPLGAVIPEEVAFRGTLLAGLLQRTDLRRAIAASAAAFALWHGTVVLVTVGDTTLAPPSLLFVPAVASALLILFVGGAIMAALRVATGSLATTIAGHWVFNAIVLIGFWSFQPSPVPSP